MERSTDGELITRGFRYFYGRPIGESPLLSKCCGVQLRGFLCEGGRCQACGQDYDHEELVEQVNGLSRLDEAACDYAMDLIAFLEGSWFFAVVPDLTSSHHGASADRRQRHVGVREVLV